MKLSPAVRKLIGDNDLDPAAIGGTGRMAGLPARMSCRT